MPERRITAGPAEQGNKLKKKRKLYVIKKKKKEERRTERKSTLNSTVFAYSFERRKRKFERSIERIIYNLQFNKFLIFG